MIRIRKIYGYVKRSYAWESRKTLTTFFSSGTKRLLTSWVLSFDTRRERHNLYYPDRSIWANKRAAYPVGHNWTGLAQVWISTSLAQRQISTNWFFSKSRRIPAHRFRLWRHSHPSTFPIWGFYYDICDCYILRARAWTALNVCTCTCTKPNSSKPN